MLNNMDVKCSFGVTKRKFYKYLRLVEALYDEARLKIDDEYNLHTKVVDPAHVAMVEIWLDKDGLDSMDSNPREFGMPIKKMRNFMSNFRYDNLMSIKVIDSEGLSYDGSLENRDYMNIKVNGYNKDIPLLDTAGMTDPNVPNISHSVNLKLNNEVLRNVLNMSVGDHIRMIADDDYLYIESTEDGDRFYWDSDEANVDLGMEWKQDVEKQEMLFADDYLKSLSKALPKSTELELSLKTDYPMRIRFNIEDGNIYGYYLMAPRIENK